MTACPDDSCAVSYVSREDKRKEFKQNYSNALATWKDIRDDLFRIGHQYFDYTAGIPEVAESLHDTWDELIHAAKVLPSMSSEHDRLVTLVLEVRELGLFTRPKKDATFGDGHEVAVMPNGQRLWTDVPYLQQEFKLSWTTESMGFTVAERESLAVLTAKLCASGVCATDLACCALWLFRETLEKERPLTAQSSGDRASKDSYPPIIDLLPACVEWLKYGNHKLVKLSVENFRPVVSDDEASTSPGPLASQVNITQHGFSVQRWLFWRYRFGELYLQGGEQVAKLARPCFEAMVGTGLEVGISIPGERGYLDSLFKALDEELIARGFKDCVGPEDIEIDPSWADKDE